MNKIFIFITLFIISSCSTTGTDGSVVSIYDAEYSKQYKGKVQDSQIVADYEDMIMPYRAEAINLKGEKFHHGQPMQSGGWGGNNVKRDVMYMCRTDGVFIDFATKDIINDLLKKNDNECLLTRYNDTIYYKDLDDYVAQKEKQKLEKIKIEQDYVQKQANERTIILTALVDRCVNFGWKTEDNIASCVKQEAYRDLQIQEQEYKIRLLEQRIASSSREETKPFFLEVLNYYAEEAERKDNEKLRRDILFIKEDLRTLKNKQNTQAALNSLYRNKSN